MDRNPGVIFGRVGRQKRGQDTQEIARGASGQGEKYFSPMSQDKDNGNVIIKPIILG